MNKKRLIICFDGTWNTENDSTNVVHQHHLTIDGVCDDGIVQKRYYDRGVGTGVMDQFIGGVLGIGLDINVLEAYLWLMDNYEDGSDDNGGDEIYIFGFSRGAYSARSLVGFIASFGLLKRGAPLSVNQLWNDYKNFDSENPDTNKVDHRRYPQIKKAADDRLELSLREKSILTWSRRVNITYLGVYDTVGALGRDALAIPGVKSRTHRYHDMRPTSIILKCRHALAINEYRAAFNNTPFVAHLGTEFAKNESLRLQSTDKQAKERKTPASQLQLWGQRIQQSWFAGAHSNIGGGYADNGLAVAPLHWIMEGAIDCGLKVHSDPKELDAKPQSGTADPEPKTGGDLFKIVDSFAEFLRGAHYVFRLRRHYRDIGPRHTPLRPPRSYVACSGSDCGPAPHSANINVRVHPSVITYYQKNPKEPIPPHLYRYADSLDASDSEFTALATITGCSTDADRSHYHSWLRNPRNEGFSLGFIWLSIWCAMSATGASLVWNFIANTGISGPNWLLAMVVATSLVVVDWLEDRTNYHLALNPYSPGLQALGKTTFFFRSIGVCCFLIGVAACAYNMAQALYLWSFQPLINRFHELVAGFLVSAVTIWMLSRTSSGRVLKFAKNAIKSGVSLIIIIAGIVGSAVAVTMVKYAPTIDNNQPALAGLLTLLLIVLAPALLHALPMIAKPMRGANIGKLANLQFFLSLEKFKARLMLLESKVLAVEPATRSEKVREAVTQSLWIDTLYSAPLLAIVFTLVAFIQLTQLKLIPDLNSAVLLLPMLYVFVALVDNFRHRYFLVPKHQARNTLFLATIVVTYSKYLLLTLGLACTIVTLVVGVPTILSTGPRWISAESGLHGHLLFLVMLAWMVWVLAAVWRCLQRVIAKLGIE